MKLTNTFGGIGAYSSRLNAEQTLQTQLNNARTANRVNKLTDRIEKSAGTRQDIVSLTGTAFITGQAATVDKMVQEEEASPRGLYYGKKLNWFEELIEKTLPQPTNGNNRLCNGGPCK
jgi:hypothetical protein